MKTDSPARAAAAAGSVSPEAEPSRDCCWAVGEAANLPLRRTSVSTARATLESNAGCKVGGIPEQGHSATWAADKMPDMRE